MSERPPEPPAGGASRSAALVTAGILASRLVGLARQRVVAHYLGTGAAADALTAALRIGNVTQNLLGEGALSASFVPVYARLRAEDERKAARFARAALGLLSIAVTALSALGVLFAPTLSALVAPGFEGRRLELVTELVRVLFPMTGVLVLCAWALAILSAHKRFVLGYAAPVIWSVAQIVAILIAGAHLGLREDGLAHAVALGALGGAVLQLAAMTAPVRNILGGIAPSFDRDAPGVREAGAKLPFAILGRGVIQLSGLVDTFLVSFLGAGAVAVFGYAQTIYLLPMALLGTGEAAAALPDLAEKRATLGEREAKLAIQASLTRSLGRVFALALGASTAFVLFGEEIVTVLLQGGSFDRAATHDVSIVLIAYAAGLPANAASRIFGAACFALGDTARPARFAAFRVVVSTGVSLALMGSLGVPGVVVGAVVAAWVELAFLGRAVKVALGGTGAGGVAYVRIAGACAVLAAVGLGTRAATLPLALHPVLGAAIVLVLAGGAFLVAADRLGALRVRALLGRGR